MGVCLFPVFPVSEDKYYQYEFKHQPSHEECVQIRRASPSLLFSRYTDLFCDQTWEDLFTELFGGPGETVILFVCPRVCVFL